jgi:hypothetical protein
MKSIQIMKNVSIRLLCFVLDWSICFCLASTLNMNKPNRTQLIAPVDLSKVQTSSTPNLIKQTTSSSVFFLPLPTLYRADIRLCTIMRADATDPPGVVMNYNKKEQFHSLNIIPGRNNGPSSKKVFFFIKSLIEMNFHSYIKHDLKGLLKYQTRNLNSLLSQRW